MIMAQARPDDGAGDSSSALLERFRQGRPDELALPPSYFALLKALADPHLRLPPVIHVAGTNGKGSTCAFLRAMLEAAGYKVHVYTSPHLVRLHERIRLAGELISEDELVGLLRECERLAPRDGVSSFEALTAAAFAAFARHPADFTILETGLGGRLDATNVVERPVATAITRISFDHRQYLGTTLAAIAGEKAGIMKSGVPCFTAQQPSDEALHTLRQAAIRAGVKLRVGGLDWRVEPQGIKGFRYADPQRSFDLPMPALQGFHQIGNAGLAIAALGATGKEIPVSAIARGLQNVEWPARLQRLQRGPLVDALPKGWEIWLDGGHNDSGGEVLARHMQYWRQAEGHHPRPMYLVYGMLTTKEPGEFLTPLAPHADALRGVAIPGDHPTLSAGEAALAARKVGIKDAMPALDIRQAINDLLQAAPRPGRILICGSLYLAGHVLRDHG